MKTEGFEPAVMVETSPDNFQAWLNHGQVLGAVTSMCAAKQLSERFSGDPSSADWRHFGRLTGFTNPKPERQLPSGLRPFSRLQSATGRVYSKAAEFVAGIGASDDGRVEQGEKPRKRRRQRAHAGVKPLQEFHAAPVYGGDLHRADMACARHAGGRGLTMKQIKGELLNGPGPRQEGQPQAPARIRRAHRAQSDRSDIRLIHYKAIKHGLSRMENPAAKNLSVNGLLKTLILQGF
jgi:hypothetical protein